MSDPSGRASQNTETRTIRADVGPSRVRSAGVMTPRATIASRPRRVLVISSICAGAILEGLAMLEERPEDVANRDGLGERVVGQGAARLGPSAGRSAW